MSNTIYVVEAANLFCGDDDPNNSKHLTIEELKLPMLTEIYQDFHPGGSNAQIEIAMGVEKLAAEFKCKGFDPQLVKMFGLGSRVAHTYSAFGALKDRRTGAHIELKAIMRGRLAKIDTDALKRGDLTGQAYEIREITHYEMFFNEDEIFYFDFFTSEWRINGVDENRELNRILRIPQTG